MSTITAIKQQKRNLHRYNLFVNGKYIASVNENTLIEKKYQAGQELSPDQLEQLLTYEKKDKLLELAFRYLEYRPRSRKEVSQYLKKKTSQQKQLYQTHEEEIQIIEKTLTQLEELDLINDTSFGQWWLEQRQTGRKPKGVWAIRSELKQKGVADDIIEKTLGAEGNTTEVSLALAALQHHRLLSRQDLDHRQYQAKAVRYLASRGFSFDTAKQAVDQLAKERYNAKMGSAQRN
ncbi:RecX family transcriptional regulator [Patescibacteria group bacterium]|nr:RecX family transcriptional regulator [Patescibacteria group bacterium]